MQIVFQNKQIKQIFCISHLYLKVTNYFVISQLKTSPSNLQLFNCSRIQTFNCLERRTDQTLLKLEHL